MPTLTSLTTYNLNKFFNAFGDTKKTITFRHKGDASYNPTTGAVSSTDTSDSIEGIVIGFSFSEIDGVHVLATDRKVYLLLDDLTFDPDLTDQVVIDGNTYEVISIKKEHSNTMTTVQVRGVA